MQVMILGSMCDPHVSSVVRLLRESHAIDVHVVDYLGSSFDLETGDDGGWTMRVDGKPVEVGVVWDRGVIVAGTPFYLPDCVQDVGYAAEEWRSLYRLISSLHGDRVVNKLRARATLGKPYQQWIAASAGFLVPPSLVTNEKASLAKFLGASPTGIIMKSLSGVKVRPASDGEQVFSNVMTMRISADDVEAAASEDIGVCPHFVQQEIRKDHELRVFWFDGECVAFRIESQKFRATEVDWRHGLAAVPTDRCELDGTEREAISRFMDAMGFATGSLDLIRDPNGRLWFLECNNQGAWAWLDEKVDGEIARLVARRLAARAAEWSAYPKTEHRVAA